MADPDNYLYCCSSVTFILGVIDSCLIELKASQWEGTDVSTVNRQIYMAGEAISPREKSTLYLQTSVAITTHQRSFFWEQMEAIYRVPQLVKYR